MYKAFFSVVGLDLNLAKQHTNHESYCSSSEIKKKKNSTKLICICLASGTRGKLP